MNETWILIFGIENFDKNSPGIYTSFSYNRIEHEKDIEENMKLSKKLLLDIYRRDSVVSSRIYKTAKLRKYIENKVWISYLFKLRDEPFYFGTELLNYVEMKYFDKKFDQKTMDILSDLEPCIIEVEEIDLKKYFMT